MPQFGCCTVLSAGYGSPYALTVGIFTILHSPGSEQRRQGTEVKARVLLSEDSISGLEPFSFPNGN